VGFYYVLYSVSCSECYFDLCFFIEFCTFLCFCTTVCESGPFGFLVLWISVCYVRVGRDVQCLDLYYIYCCVVCVFYDV
jgi:hypothetical protein